MKGIAAEMKFRYCPRCGQPGFRAFRKNSLRCRACDFEYFINAAAAVAVLICDAQGRLLLTRRKHDPAAGMLDLPGGFADIAESAEAAAVREIKEELNLDICDLRYFCSSPNRYHYADVNYATLDLAYTARVKNFRKIRVWDDISGYSFHALDQIPPADIAFESIRYFVGEFIKKKKNTAPD